MRRVPLALLLTLLCLPACATAMRGCFSGRAARRAEEADPGPPHDEVVVGACNGLGGSDEVCRIALRIDATRCDRDHPCPHLVAFFPDRADDCGGHARLLRVFAEAGWVAACLGLYESRADAGAATLAAREERARAALEALGAAARVRAAWSRADLLVAGEGLGAGTAMRALVRTEEIADAERVRACFFDGLFDIAAELATMTDWEAHGDRCRRSLETLGAIYCDPRSPGGGCDDEAVTSMRDDSVDVTDPANVLASRLLLFECGSELSSCDQDGAPAEQATSLCESLGAERCETRSAPRVPHDRCATRNVDACIEWSAR